MGRCAAGWAQGSFIGVLCWLYRWLRLVCCWGFHLVWLLLRVRCWAWCRHAMSTRCAAVACRDLLSAPSPRVWAVRGVAGVVFPAVVILCAAADCAHCLQSLLLAAGSLRSLLCPNTSSALCRVLHTTSHLNVSKSHM